MGAVTDSALEGTEHPRMDAQGLVFSLIFFLPILFKDLIIFLPDTEGSLGTCHFHTKDFSIRPRLFP